MSDDPYPRNPFGRSCAVYLLLALLMLPYALLRHAIDVCRARKGGRR